MKKVLLLGVTVPPNTTHEQFMDMRDRVETLIAPDFPDHVIHLVPNLISATEICVNETT